MKTFREYLQEAMVKLTPAEWKKPNSATKQPRTDILIDAIKSGQSVTLVNNKEVVLKNTQENILSVQNFVKSGGKKAFDLITKDGKIISSSDIGKSPMFGGGGGAGGGTENTAIVESAQCLWTAALLGEGVKPIEHFTPTVLSKYSNKVDIGKTTLEEIFNIDAKWAFSSYESAKALIKQGFVNNKHVFHRDSKGMKQIYAAKKVAFKNTGMSPMIDDKWNPGDIWAIDPSVNLSEELDTTDIYALNSSLLRLYKDRKVVGISLKLVKKNVKITELNYDESLLDTHKFKGVAVKSSKGTFFSNKGGVIEFDAGKMEVRPNNYLGTNKVEISGKTARGGGAGWTVLEDYVKKDLKATLLPHAKIKTDAIAMSKGDEKKMKEFYKMAKFIEPSVGKEEEFIGNLKQQDAGWIAAKYASTILCFLLVKNKGKRADEFITSIVNYAGSKSKESSVYVKVYE